MAGNPMIHVWTKHMEIDLFFVREKLLSKQLDAFDIQETGKKVDIFTKPLTTPSF